ncbi:MAG TPA: AzlD domain-containing protein [Aggregatilineales bacterium]|nr:AzlD domain-containing protein [Chloroflexota bacterium]HOA22746.1 AzlD domain-containing protein [Aggregatilineales bacterium]HPV07182.1 AzlD domain-containing protein [Aggregatilineales bacterium]HQA66799.1 AzlD domain-containing protein [Aggregatilineales bacterium]HQE17244.1 AzlD domain-containing protein [Aggregatilineales bacterium]
MDQTTVFLIIVGMAVVTYIPRALPMLALSQRKLPEPVAVWLRYVPVAVLSALLLPSLVVQEGRLDLSAGNLFLWAAIPTLLVAWRTRSMFGAVITGMLIVALARLVGVG